MKNWKLFLPLIRQHKTTLIGVVFLMMFTAAVTALLPWPLKLIVDHLLSAKPIPESLSFLQGIMESSGATAVLLLLVLTGLLLQILLMATKLIQSVIETAISQKLTLGFGEQILEHLQKMSLLYHGKQNSGDLVRRVTTDTRCVAEIVLGVLLPLLTSTFTLILMFIIMIKINVAMTLIALCAAIPIPMLIKWLAPKMTEQTYAHQEREGELVSVAEQTLTGLPVVQAFGQEARQNKHFKLLSEGTMDAYLAAVKAQLQFSVGVSASTAIGSAFMMIIGGFYVMKGSLTLGELLVFLAYVAALYGPVETLAYLSSVYATAMGRVKRVMEVLDLPPSVQNDKNAQPLLISEKGVSLTFSNIEFSYNEGEPILNGIDLNVKAGETVAFVGSTGSGKSTLVSLIPRFYNLNNGSICIDGQNIESIKLDDLRANISLVLQDPFLLPMTIAENIAYGKPSASNEEIVNAAISSNAHEFIEKLPMGYETVLSEQAGNLSGGQKQRVAIARALLKDAPILILDEPTSALDARSESLFIEAIERLMVGRTTFIIAHRLSTIRNSDKIVVLDSGCIVEMGTEQELMALEGFYSQLAA